MEEQPNNILNFNGKSSSFNLDNVARILRRVVGVVESIEQGRLQGGAHHNQSNVSTLLNVFDKRTQDIRLQRSFVGFINNEHRVSEGL